MNEPKIGERVKFWQEQDRINRELIPRVIKGHELLTRHVESHEDGDSLARAQIESLQTRMTESHEETTTRIESLRTQMAESHEATTTRIESLRTQMAESHEATTTRIESLQTQMAENHEAATARIDTLDARVTELEARSPNELSRWLPYAALALSVFALVLALVR